MLSWDFNCFREISSDHSQLLSVISCKFSEALGVIEQNDFFVWRVVYIQETLIRKYSYLVMGSSESLLTFHKFWPQGPCPGVGLELKVWDTLKSVMLLFLLCLPILKTLGQTSFRVTSWRLSEWYLEDYLMGEWHTWYNGSVWHKDWPHGIYVVHWPIFHGPLILPYTCILKTVWWMKVILGIIGQSVTQRLIS